MLISISHKVVRYACSILILLLVSVTMMLAVDSCSPARKDEVVVGLNGASDTWSKCNGSFLERFEIPQGANVFPYTQQLLTGPYGTYSQAFTKLDIVWISDSITIDKPLRSFGGDIVLVTNTLTINAPIDTRVYVEHDVDFWEPAHDSRSRTDTDVENNFEFGVKGMPDYYNAYRDYYLHCQDCASGETRRAQLPSGLVAATHFGIGSFHYGTTWDGEPAPDNLIAFQNIKSGNVYIFTHSVTIKPALKNPTVPTEFSECAGAPAYAPFAINVAGLQGGRGGAGSSSMSTRHNPASGEFDLPAITYTMQGGLSGAGGKGGDAGNVYIGFINVDSTKADALAQELKTVTSLQGGEPGSNRRYRTPSARGPYAATGNRCSFRPAPSEQDYPAASSGNVGAFQYELPSAPIALGEITRLINGKSARTDYDLYTIAQLCRIDPNIRSIQPTGALDQYLSRTLANTEVKFIADLDRVLGLGGSEQLNYLPDYLAGISQISLDNIPFRDQQGSLARELQNYDGLNKDMFNVFRQSGGMFNIRMKNRAMSRMSEGQLLVTVNKANVTLEKVNDSLRHLDEQFFLIMSDIKAQQFKKQVLDLQQAIAQLEEELRKQAQGPDVVETLGKVIKCGKAIGELIAAIYSENAIAIAEAVKNGVDAFQSLNTTSKPPLLQLPVLKAELASVQLQFDQLTQFVADKKQEYLAKQYSDLIGFLQARNAYEESLNSDMFLVPDLVKVAIASYYEDSAHDQGLLRSNLAALQTYIKDFPAKQPFIRLSDIDFSCSHPDKCRFLQASSHRREIVYNQQFGVRTRKLPLYVVAPAEASNGFPTFLLDPDKVVVVNVH